MSLKDANNCGVLQSQSWLLDPMAFDGNSPSNSNTGLLLRMQHLLDVIGTEIEQK
jgi:hypothetical protein